MFQTCGGFEQGRWGDLWQAEVLGQCVVAGQVGGKGNAADEYGANGREDLGDLDGHNAAQGESD